MDISFGEIVLICLIAFLVLGPKELVLRANQLGRWIAKMRTELNNFKVIAQEQILKDEHLKDIELKDRKPFTPKDTDSDHGNPS